MFNLIQIAANGTSLKNQDAIGLYGPIILISKSNYDMIGGHESVRTSIVEDIALGQRLKNTNIPYNLFIGDEEISFRMYSGGLRSLFQGWVKNIATGANSIPKSLFWMVFIWISSIASVPIHMLAFVIKKNLLLFMISFFLYIVWTIILYFLSKKIGKYNILAIVFYPILIIALLIIFIVSLIRRMFGISVIWKGRAISWEGKNENNIST